jgi:hypothetical protein
MLEERRRRRRKAFFLTFHHLCDNVTHKRGQYFSSKVSVNVKRVAGLDYKVKRYDNHHALNGTVKIDKAFGRQNR